METPLRLGAERSSGAYREQVERFAEVPAAQPVRETYEVGIRA